MFKIKLGNIIGILILWTKPLKQKAKIWVAVLLKSYN